MKIALIQQKFHLNKEQTIKKTCEFIEEASKQGAELVCLGELHQSEYFCQSENVDFFDYANDYEKDVKFWANIARKNQIVLIASL
ncbi:N-carbamoylputrescine amidohydrolase, partial [Campylobacter jejuni]|nr:N-carbamoylputrescine amidohydrolase [Campylobacter jejuni]